MDVTLYLFNFEYGFYYTWVVVVQPCEQRTLRKSFGQCLSNKSNMYYYLGKSTEENCIRLNMCNS